MDVVWSREFLVALLCFLAPVAIAAALVYWRVWHSNLRRRRRWDRVAEAGLRRVLDQAAPPETAAAVPAAPPVTAAAIPAAPAAAESLQRSLENLRQRLVEFQASIQQSRSALRDLQECDFRFSEGLNRASEVMQHAFTK